MLLEEAVRQVIRDEVKKSLTVFRREQKAEKEFLLREDNICKPWTAYEDQYLQREIEVAITLIANQHKRSIGAIKSRLYQKELLKTL